MTEGKRFYWLKLKRDFFKRHDIRIIENMPNGKDYILFYLKLLCESIDHDGNLRFSEKIPYSEEMLATITDTNVDIVRAAVNMFIQLGMMEMMDDGTFFMCEVQKMIGSAADNDNANRVRRFRDRQKESFLLEQRNVTKCNAAVTGDVTEDNESKRIDRDIDLDTDIEVDSNDNKKKGANNGDSEIRCNDAWRNSTKARGATAQLIVDAMRRSKLEHADYPIIFDTVNRCLMWGITPNEILQAAKKTDYVGFNLWFEKERSQRTKAI